MNLNGFSNRDKSIITKNPNLDAYELKELGLSDKGFERFLEQSASVQDEAVSDIVKVEEEEEVNEIQVAEEETNIISIKEETIGNAPQVVQNHSTAIVSESVLVRNKQTGFFLLNRMSRTAALRLNPNQFEIVEDGK